MPNFTVISVVARRHRMTTHLFGAITSSPSCSNLALRRTAVEDQCCSRDVSDTINNHFYVDDCLRSVDSEDRAIILINELCSTLQKGGFRLHKWVSNNQRVLESVPETDRRKDVQSISLEDNLPHERALGVLWNTELDMFSFKIELKERPLTRREILSTLSSIYDPLGLAAPAILPAKQILQELCRIKLQWDDNIPVDQERKWLEWLAELHKLEEFYVNRCLKP